MMVIFSTINCYINILHNFRSSGSLFMLFIGDVWEFFLVMNNVCFLTVTEKYSGLSVIVFLRMKTSN